MSVLYVSTLFLSYKALKFEILSNTTVFLCGVYCTSKCDPTTGRPNFDSVVPLANHIACIKRLGNNCASLIARSVPQPMSALNGNIFLVHPIVLRVSLN